jgi:hypothetical protein
MVMLPKDPGMKQSVRYHLIKVVTFIFEHPVQVLLVAILFYLVGHMV